MTGGLSGRQWRLLIAAGVAYAATYVSFYGVSIALPAIGRELDASGVQVEWVMNASLLAFAAPLIAIGRLVDIFGARDCTAVGALIIAVATALCGLSPNVEVLIAARAFQGIGTATVSVAAIALVSNVFVGKSQSVGVSLLTGIGMVGGMAGPFLAGVITDSLSWRWFFFIISGLAAAGLVLCLLLAEKDRREDAEKKIDVVGFLLLTASLLLLILGLQFVDTDGWLAPDVVGCIAAAVVCAVVFYVVEKKVASPLVDFSFFRNPTFSGACLVMFFIYLPYGALMVYLALYLQHVLGYSALASGVIYLALMVPTTVISLLGGKALNLAGPRFTLNVSIALITVGFVFFGFVHPTTGLGLVVIGLFFVGAGRGLSSTVPFAMGLSTVSKEKAGAASGVLETVSTVAMPIGIAICGAFFRVWENDELAHIFKVAGGALSDSQKTEIFGLLSGSEAMKAKLAGIAPAIADRIELVAGEAFSHAFRNLMFLSIGLFVAVPVSIHLMRQQAAESESAKATKD